MYIYLCALFHSFFTFWFFINVLKMVVNKEIVKVSFCSLCSCGGRSGVSAMHCLRSPMFFSYSCSVCWSSLSWLLNCLGKGKPKNITFILLVFTLICVHWKYVFYNSLNSLSYFFCFIPRGLLTINGSPYFTDYTDIVFDLYVLVTTANSPDVM